MHCFMNSCANTYLIVGVYVFDILGLIRYIRIFFQFLPRILLIFIPNFFVIFLTLCKRMTIRYDQIQDKQVRAY